MDEARKRGAHHGDGRARILRARPEPERDPAGRDRARAEQHGHPRCRRQSAELPGLVEPVRPPPHLRRQDAGRRLQDVRLLRAEAGAGRALAGGARRHVGDAQAAPRREVSRRHAGDRQGREVVLRPRGERRRVPDLPDEGGVAREARAIRSRRRFHVQDQALRDRLRQSADHGMAPAHPVQDRHRQGQGAPRRGGPAERLRRPRCPSTRASPR